MYVRFSPLIDSMFFDRDLTDMFSGFDISNGVLRAGLPAVDVAEHDSKYEIVAELPGVKREDLKVSVEDGTLTLSGERKQYGFPEGIRVVRHETPTRSFTRSFELPKDVDQTRIAAELKDGVLRVQLPKAEHARPRQITVT